MSKAEAEEEIEDAIRLLWQLPSGIDVEADESDLSPDDASAHIAGLVLRRLEDALEELRNAL